MADGIHPVTSSEWKLVQRRLDDLENLVTDLTFKLETLEERKCNRTNSYLEHQRSDEEKTETIIKLNAQSTSAASGIIGVAGQGQSTIQTVEKLTLAGLYVINTAESAATPSSESKLSNSISVNATANGTPVSMKSTSRLPRGIWIQNLGKYHPAQVKLNRCEQDAMGTSSSSQFKVENKHTPTLTHKESHIYISSKKCSVLQRKRNGVRSAQVSTQPLSHEKRFACHLCPRRFDDWLNFTHHIGVHTGDKPFHCTICFKAFTQEAHLKTHTRIHTGDKPFECGFCSKKFSGKQNLIVHMTRHTGERPYTCQICSKRFTRHSSLAVHLRVHTREKPYSCPFCPKVFAQSNNLKSHLNRQHPGETPERQDQIHHEEFPKS